MSPPPARVWGGLLLPYAQQEELELPRSCVCQIHRLSHFGNSKIISSISVANFSIKGRLCTMSFSCRLLAEWVCASTTGSRGIEGFQRAIELSVLPKWNDPAVKNDPLCLWPSFSYLQITYDSVFLSWFFLQEEARNVGKNERGNIQQQTLLQRPQWDPETFPCFLITKPEGKGDAIN